MNDVYNPRAHRDALDRLATETYERAYAERGAYEAYWARRSVYGYMYPGDNYSRVGVLRCDRPMGAPMSAGSLAEDMRYGGTFTIDHVESHFGDSMLQDTSGRWHELENVRVLEWMDPETLEQRKQDRILGRLEAAYGL